MSTSRSSTQFEHLGAEAAVRALLVLVGEDRGERVLDVLDPVGADDLRERVAVRAGAELEVRAVVVDAVDPQRAEGAVVVEGELGVVVSDRSRRGRC